MADKTHIEWTDATWQIVTGCTLVSEGCRHCYAARLAATRLKDHPSRAGLARVNAAGEAKFTGEVRFNAQWLDQPLHWRKPRRIFVCAHGDLFHEAVPDEWIDQAFAVMALSPQHTFQVLTKRPERMREYLSSARAHPVGIEAMGLTLEAMAANPRSKVGSGVMLQGDIVHLKVWPLPNVWLGTSVENQETADARIPHLLATPAAVRFLSAEPLLGPVDIGSWLSPDAFCEGCDDGEGYGNRCNRSDIPRSEQCPWVHAVQTVTEHGPFESDGAPASVTSDVVVLDWVIVGGESGPGARPMHPDWARRIRDQCAEAGVAFFFKQWGTHAPASVVAPGDHLPEDADVMLPSGKSAAGRMLDGITHDAMPEVHHG